MRGNFYYRFFFAFFFLLLDEDMLYARETKRCGRLIDVMAFGVEIAGRSVVTAP